MPRDPFFDRRNKRDSGAHGRKAEKRGAKRLAARLTPGSGALDGAKSDMVRKDFRIESKSTIHSSIKIDLDWLLKIAQEALEKAQEPALLVQFVRGDGKPVRDGAWVMISEDKFRELTE